MPSPNLALTHVAAAQNQKEVTVNDAIDGLDRAMTATLEVDCSAGGTVAVSAADLRRHVRLLLAGNPGAAFTLELADVPRLLAVRNATDAAGLLSNTAGLEAVEVPPGAALMVYAGPDGVTGVGAAGGGVYDFGAVSMATPGPGDVIGKVVIPRDVRMPAEFAGAVGDVDVPPDAAWSVDVTVDGLTVGTINVSTTGLVTFTTTSPDPVQIDAGSVVRFVASSFAAPAEASVAGLSVTLRGAVI